MKNKSSSLSISLVRATHFPQALTMVILTTTAVYLSGQHGIPLILVLLATAAGQASIGWVNDYIDASSDKENNRLHKPIVTNSLSQSNLRFPIAIALIATVPLSFLAGGWIGGTAHILAVASAQLYNLYLARTVWSFIPYAISFGLLTVFVTQASSLDNWPSWQMVLIAVCVGITAHILNALPDLEIDKKSQLGGLVVSLGKAKSFFIVALLAVVTLATLLSLLVS